MGTSEAQRTQIKTKTKIGVEKRPTNPQAHDIVVGVSFHPFSSGPLDELPNQKAHDNVVGLENNPEYSIPPLLSLLRALCASAVPCFT